MTSKEIYKTLRYSLSHDYILENVYIFRWESDFFAISKGGLSHEIEVKMSRGDFKADFKKIKKHQELEMAHAKKNMFTIRRHLKYEFKKDSGYFANQLRTRMTTDFEVEAREGETINLISSGIAFKPTFTPNRFYYACPKDLIKKSEIPKYAGLYYIEKHNILTMIKQAPILHRIKHDFKGILLQKFYQLSLNQNIEINGIRFELEKLRKFEGDIIGFNKDTGLQTEIEF